MLLGRRSKSRLDILRPLTAERVEEKQLKQKSKHDDHAHKRLLNEGDTVLVRNYFHGQKWKPGIIIKKTGPVSYSVKLSDGCDRRCHQDQVRKIFAEVNIPEKEVGDHLTLFLTQLLTETQEILIHLRYRDKLKHKLQS